MSGKLVISKRQHQIITSYMEGNQLTEVQCQDIEKKQLIGNIYIGKVKNIVKNIQAAFVDIGLEENAYFSLEQNTTILYSDYNHQGPLRIGDELIVQVIKEGTKTKGPVLTSHLNLTGRYVVLTVGKPYIGISNKITDLKFRSRVKAGLKPFVTDTYGFIFRTNGWHVPFEIIEAEVNELIERYIRIEKIGQYRSCYQIVEKAPSAFMMSIRDYYQDQMEQIVVDDEEIYEDIKAYLSEYQPEDLNKLQYYDDANLSLFDLYGLKTKINEALKAKVWLKSGGYIVISPTEALVAIDVNTGKYAGNKKFEETIFKINKDAAKEIARQIRLRNLSGIIIVDFIDMKSEDQKEALLDVFSQYLRQDPVKTTLVGMTSLNLVQLTRKKIRAPIYDQFGKACTCCGGKGYTYRIETE